MKQPQRELCKFQARLSHFLDFSSVLLAQRLGNTAWQTANRMRSLSANDFSHLLPVGSVFYNFLAYFQSCLLNYTNYVPLLWRRVGTNHKVRSAQIVKVQSMVVNIVGRIHQLPQLFRSTWRLHIERSV